MDKLTELRKFRLDLENHPFLNSDSQGIALFDLIGTFLIAYFFEKYFTTFIPRKIYYASLIPLGVIIHYIINQKTFLNFKLLSNNFNIYQLLFLCLIFYIINF